MKKTLIILIVSLPIIGQSMWAGYTSFNTLGCEWHDPQYTCSNGVTITLDSNGAYTVRTKTGNKLCKPAKGKSLAIGAIKVDLASGKVKCS